MHRHLARRLREQKRLRQEHGRLLDGWVDEFKRADPMRLGSESPDDEYEPEVATILPRLRECAGPADLERVIHEEFSRWFGADMAGPPTNYRALSSVVWRLYQRDFPDGVGG